MQTLIVNQSFEPLQIVGWQKAVYLILTEKADLITSYDKEIRSISMSIMLPKVVMVKGNHRIKKKKIQFSKLDVFERDNYVCQYCGKSLKTNEATLDHVIPKSKGGQNSYENTVCACEKCNGKKADKSLKEANMKLLSQPKNVKREVKEKRIFEQFLKDLK